MFNDIYIVALIINMIIIGVNASISDFKFNKVYNKAILLTAVSAIAIQFFNVILLLNLGVIEIVDIGVAMLCLSIGIVGSFILYKKKLWAAGDSKLYTVLVVLLPIQNLVNIKEFARINLQIFATIFGIAYIYIMFETAYLLLRDISNNRFEMNIKKSRVLFGKIEKKNIVDFIFRYFKIYVIISGWNLFIYRKLGLIYSENRFLFMLLNIFLVIKILKRIKYKGILNIVTFVMLVYLFMNDYFYQNHNVNYKYMILIFLMMIFRYIAKLYNYKRIKVEDLKPGMILSLRTIIEFKKSRVRGLPKITYENTESRLSIMEVDAINRWSKSKHGEDKIIIVRHMPFAPFVFVGFFIQIIIEYGM